MMGVILLTFVGFAVKLLWWAKYPSILPASIVFICIFLWLIIIWKKYRQLHVPLIILGSGVLLNYIVVLANNGYMPVASQYWEWEKGASVYYRQDGKLLFLSDWLPPRGASLGDYLIMLGWFYALQKCVWQLLGAKKIKDGK